MAKVGHSTLTLVQTSVVVVMGPYLHVGPAACGDTAQRWPVAPPE
jgi:hypothetical protein